MKRILLVEDDPLILNLIVILLEREGYAVSTCASAEEGMALAEAQRPDLILMDVALPGLDGLSATRQLKAREATRALPIIALTAQAMKEDERKALDAGCDGFIVKPLSTQAFLKQIARFLEEHAQAKGQGA